MNLLFICADTFRADYLGCYGNTWVETPNLDRLASQGVHFEDFYSDGLPTIPVRRAYYTGRRVFPFRVFPTKNDTVRMPGWHPLSEEDITIAEWLRERGYTSGLISDVYHQMKPGQNLHRGFHSWQWIRGQENDPLVPVPAGAVDLSRRLLPRVLSSDTTDARKKRQFATQYLLNRAGWKGEADHFAAQVMRAAAEWIERYGHSQPWMLWVESFDPHEPWDAPAEYVDKYCPNYEGLEDLLPPGFVGDYSEREFARIKAHYAGECTHVDRWCGYLLDALEAQGLLDDTVVVFTSDHGTMMGEQGEIHKGQNRVRIQETRCPLIIRHPDRAHAGKVVEGFVQHQDLMPTLLHLLGQPIPGRCDGQNAWSLVTGERQGGLHDVIITGFGWYASVRTREWNYQAPWVTIAGGRVRAPELYDRHSDPQELVNVIDRHPEVAARLHGILEERVRDVAASIGTVGDIDMPAAVPGVKW